MALKQCNNCKVKPVAKKGDKREMNGRVWVCTDPDIDRWVSCGPAAPPAPSVACKHCWEVDCLTCGTDAAPSVADAAGARESAIYDAMVQCCEIHGYEVELEVLYRLSRSVVKAIAKESSND